MTTLSPGLVAQCFSPTYAVARAKFQLAAAQAGATLHVYTNPEVKGPDGGTLTTDVAVLGAANPRRTLVIVSGTHGPECFIGSAAQIALMQSLADNAAALRVRLVLIHTINPYGAAHVTRSTENNVDLNRNFIDWSAGAPRNEHYTELHPWIGPKDRTPAEAEEAKAAVAAWIAKNGMTAYTNASMCGQYTHPDGLSFGGEKIEWSHTALRAIVSEHVAGAEKVALIDWHTGLGERGEPFFLCFNEIGGAAWERACKWWGRERIESSAAFEGAERPKYTGLLFDGVTRYSAPAEVTGAVIEFGTDPLAVLQEALQADRRLQFGMVTDAAERIALQEQVAQAFSPTSLRWQTSTLQHAVAIQRQAIAGLMSW